MATLTTEWQEVASSNKRFTYGGVTYDFTFKIDAKYSRTETQRLNKKSTIYTRLRSIKNSAGTVYSDARPSFSLSYAPTRTATGRWTYATETITTSEGVEVSHDTNGNFSATLTATISDSSWGSLSHSFNTSVSIPQIILNPTIEINGPGGPDGGYLIMTNTDKNVNVTLTNAVKSTTIYFKVYNGSTEVKSYSRATGKTSGTFNVSIPIDAWNYITDRDNTNLCRLVATNNDGTGQCLCRIQLDESTKPTISSVVISGTNPSSASDLGSNLVRGITIPKITTTANPVYSSPIVRYELLAFTGYDGALPKNITQTYNGTKPYNALSVTATVRVYDNRNHYQDYTTSAVSVVDYSFPVLNCYVKRCDKNGVLDENGTFGKLFTHIEISPIRVGSENKNVRILKYSLDNGEHWVPITTSSYTQDIETKIGTGETGPFNVTGTYDILVHIEDIANKTETKLQIVPSFTTVSLHSGGKGVSVGRIATADELQVYMQTHINNGLYIDDTLVLWEE